MIRAFTCAAVASALVLVSTGAKADYASFNLTVNALPVNYTFCRDAAAIAAQYDQDFGIFIDVDNNSSTGVKNSGGVDVALIIQTSGLTAGCAPFTAPLKNNVYTGEFVPNAAGDDYDQTNVSGVVTLDYEHNIISVAVPLSGPLAGLTSDSKIYVGSAAPYQTTGGMKTQAQDQVNPFEFGFSMGAPVNNVQQCSAPCSTSLSWYKFDDLINASATTKDWIFVGQFDQ